MTENKSAAPKPPGRGRRKSSAQGEPASVWDRAEGHAIDELDRAIIRILQKNGRTNNTDIARDLDVTETTIRKRIAQLLEDGMINVVAVPTPKAVGSSTSAIIGLSVALHSIHQVSDRLRKCPEVRYVGMSAGRYDLMVEVFASDQEHLLEFLTDRLGSMDGITDVETSVILKVVKFSYEWEIV
jgi:Lrp/AsnC family transcriptional regulator for asnA, asnC and gidA